jgi:hypothetical protein
LEITQQEGDMADDIRRDERDHSSPSTREGSERHAGSPLGTDPQEAAPLPGDPREAQEPQEPRTTHIGAPGRQDAPFHEETSRPIETQGEDGDRMEEEPEGEDRGAVDELREAWDRMRGKS